VVYAKHRGNGRAAEMRGEMTTTPLGWDDEEPGTEVAVTANNAEHLGHQLAEEDLSLDELARRKGVRPVRSVRDMARPGVFESDEELEAFLAHVSASRHADIA